MSITTPNSSSSSPSPTPGPAPTEPTATLIERLQGRLRHTDRCLIHRRGECDCDHDFLWRDLLAALSAADARAATAEQTIQGLREHMAQAHDDLADMDNRRATLAQERDTLRQALQDVVAHKGCGDPDCCEASITQEHFRVLAENLLKRLAEARLPLPVEQPQPSYPASHWAMVDATVDALEAGITAEELREAAKEGMKTVETWTAPCR